MLSRAKRGDVCVVMAHVERAELIARLESEGFQAVDADRLRQLIGA